MRFNAIRIAATLFVAACAAVTAGRAAAATPDEIHDTVTRNVAPLMKQFAIPGMAIGIVADGKPYVFDYGVMSTQTGKPVTGDTLFEIGSVSKTLTGTLASDAQEGGELSLSDPVAKYLPALQGKPFGGVTLLELGTYTPGGMPLQVPDSIRDDAALMRYLDAWRPAYAPGTRRTYSNVALGMLGQLTAKAMNGDFAALMEQRLFPALGMTHTYINVPAARRSTRNVANRRTFSP